MNTNVKNIIIFAAGVATGALVSVKVLQNKYDLIAQEEIDSVKRHYKENLKDIKEETRIYRDGGELINLDDRQIFSKEEKKDYAKITKTYDGEDNEETGIPLTDTTDEPYVIPLDHFMHTNKHYDKLSITYYEEDDTLADDQEEIIPDVSMIIGDEALMCFGEGSDDPDTVYVRNDKTNTDFEVTRLYKSYKKTVLGMHEDAPHQRRMRSDE